MSYLTFPGGGGGGVVRLTSMCAGPRPPDTVNLVPVERQEQRNIGPTPACSAAKDKPDRRNVSDKDLVRIMVTLHRELDRWRMASRIAIAHPCSRTDARSAIDARREAFDLPCHFSRTRRRTWTRPRRSRLDPEIRALISSSLASSSRQWEK